MSTTRDFTVDGSRRFVLIATSVRGHRLLSTIAVDPPNATDEEGRLRWVRDNRVRPSCEDLLIHEPLVLVVDREKASLVPDSERAPGDEGRRPDGYSCLSSTHDRLKAALQCGPLRAETAAVPRLRVADRRSTMAA